GGRRGGACGVQPSWAIGSLEIWARGAAGWSAAAGGARFAAAGGEPSGLDGPAGRGSLGRAATWGLGYPPADRRVSPATGTGPGQGPEGCGRRSGDQGPRLPAAGGS